jgi:hypothetical protein
MASQLRIPWLKSSLLWKTNISHQELLWGGTASQDQITQPVLEWEVFIKKISIGKKIQFSGHYIIHYYGNSW